MRVALIGDVHGNLPALEAVLADAARRGVEAIWNVGDFVGYGAFADEVVACLREVRAVSIVGNYDRKVLEFPGKQKRWQARKAPEKLEAFRWAYEHLSPESLAHLAELPRERRMTVNGARVLLTHGSPAFEDEPLTDATDEARLAELAAVADADLVVCGHSHRPMAREVAGVLFVGTGSVGRPAGGDPRACYAVLAIDADGTPAVEHVRLEYDVARAAEAIRRSGQAEAFARMVELGVGYDELPRAQAASPGEAAEQRERAEVLAAVQQLMLSCRNEQGHSRQVTGLALRLFDELAGLHGLGERERFWLQCGAMLHDIGWIDGQKAHHKTSLRLIEADRTLPIDDRERRIIASVARYHRKALPADGHAHFAALDACDRRAVSVLGGILRVADGLDRSHCDAVDDLRCEIRPDCVYIHCFADGSADIELWAAEKKSDLLCRALGREVIVSIV
jgi:putative phosphoesterase